MTEFYKAIPAVLVAIIKGDQVLLGRRVNTGYMDGYYGLPGGHLEAEETLAEGAARELKEETGLIVKPEDLELFHVYQNKNTSERHYLGFMFRAKKWLGTPRLKEHKSDDVAFFDLGKLPTKIIPYHRETLLNINNPAIKISYIAPDSFDPSGK